MTKVRKKIGTIPINDIEQQVQQSTSAAITQMQQDVSDFIDEETAQYPEIGGTFKYIEDPEERSEIVTDKEGKVLSYREKDGTMVENIGIKTNIVSTKGIKISDEGLSDLAKDLRNLSLISNDWSDKTELHIKKPYCARINFSGINNIPQAKGVDMKGYMEFWDMNGNYFKKEVIMNAQGNSSLSHPKKNIAIDMCNNNGWDDDDTFKLQIGNWVPQDSFHLKGYYVDYFRGIAITSYTIYENIIQTLNNVMTDRPWKKALIDMDSIDVTAKGFGDLNDNDLQTDTGALNHPDGFPCIVYLNGDFYGIYSFQLKKHRDNYHMSKSDPKHIHLDGELKGTEIFAGNIVWTKFEIRNPKNLVYAEVHTDAKGKPTFKYDADIVNGEDEIAGTDKNYDGDWVAGSYAVGRVVKHNGNYFINQVADNSKEPITQDASGNKNTAKDPDFKNKTKCGWVNCTNSVKVKQYIIDFSQRITEIEAEDDATQKVLFNKYYDLQNLIDYTIFSDVVDNNDGYDKNWQWTTYDGEKWFVNAYDLDVTFGNTAAGNNTTLPKTQHISYGGPGFPHWYMYKFYNQQLKECYAKVRETKVIDADSIISILKGWQQSIGTEVYKKEYEKWKDAPCNNDNVVNTEFWEVVKDEQGNYITDSSSTWSDSVNYNIGDTCSFGMNAVMGFYVFNCIKANTNQKPISRFCFRDNLYRIYKWIKKSIENMDVVYNYNQN